MTLAELKEKVDRLVEIVEHEIKDDPENFDLVLPSVFDDGYDYLSDLVLTFVEGYNHILVEVD